MANKPRPACSVCGKKMVPLFRKGARGTSFMRAGQAFMCLEDGTLAKGRGKKVAYLK